MPSLSRSTWLFLVFAVRVVLGPTMAFGLDSSEQAGQELFEEHCAPCHGSDGSGKGPLASTLEVAPSDLTQISKRAGGAFPAARVVEIITFGAAVAGHGNREMPIWGDIFKDDAGGGRRGAASARSSVLDLKRYLETIQKH